MIAPLWALLGWVAYLAVGVALAWWTGPDEDAPDDPIRGLAWLLAWPALVAIALGNRGGDRDAR